MRRPTNREYAEFNALVQELKRIKAELKAIRRRAQGRKFQQQKSQS